MCFVGGDRTRKEYGRQQILGYVIQSVHCHFEAYLYVRLNCHVKSAVMYPVMMSNTSKLISSAMVRDAKAGAITTINCAVNPHLNSGQCFYYDSCQVKEPSAISRCAHPHRNAYICIYCIS